MQSRNHYVDANVDGMVDVLVIQLVSEEKFLETRKPKAKAPKKKLFTGAFENSSGPMATVNVVSRDGLNMNLRARNSEEARRFTSEPMSYTRREEDRERVPPVSNRGGRQGRRTRSSSSRGPARAAAAPSPRRTGSTNNNDRRRSHDTNVDADDERVGTSFETADDDTMDTEGLSFGDE